MSTGSHEYLTCTSAINIYESKNRKSGDLKAAQVNTEPYKFMLPINLLGYLMPVAQSPIMIAVGI